ncbi:hypothetical protein ACRS7F_13340 [Brucella anthropi]|uniref:hypothetical protein n=1 Tax=Brucella anthropi TaxID=529 RepID=UPI003EE21356
MTTFTARTTLSLAAWDAGPEFEVEMLVKFTVTKARAQTQLEPEEPATVENISIRLFEAKGKSELACPPWAHEWFADDDGFKDWLMSEANEQYQQAAEDHADQMREMRRESGHA